MARSTKHRPGKTRSSMRVPAPSARPTTTDEDSPARQTAGHFHEADIEWLDTQVFRMKRSGWHAANRSVLLRALVAAARQRGTDLTGAFGEAELAERLAWGPPGLAKRG